MRQGLIHETHVRFILGRVNGVGWQVQEYKNGPVLLEGVKWVETETWSRSGAAKGEPTKW